MITKKILLAGILATVCTTVFAADTKMAEKPAAMAAKPVFMSAEWAKLACDAWNNEPTLTEKLKKSEWVDNHGTKAYKVMQIYREGCESSPRVEMHIADKDGKAMCVYGGAATTKAEDMSKKSDYIMWATDDHWARMGDGRDGPMKSMMFGRLHFKGPKMEAMGNMGPFAKFLLLTGKVDSDRSKCP